MSQPHLLPEWAPARAVLLAWPYPDSDWGPSFAAVQACYVGMAVALSRAAPVWLMLHPTLSRPVIETALNAAGADLSRFWIWDNVPYDDTWVRDYGPLSLSNGGHLALTFNGWGGKYEASRDNAIAQMLAERQRLELIKSNWVGEGGALETNGHVLLLNGDCAIDECRNPGFERRAVEDTLRDLLGLQTLLWVDDVTLTGDDTDGHIDTLVRFVDEQVLVYAGRNSAHPDAKILDRLHIQVSKLAAQQGWRAFELPSPLVASQVDGRQLPATYANFLWLNGHLLVPVYGVAEDAAALELLGRLRPDVTLIPVRAEALLEQHGSLHCATMQIH